MISFLPIEKIINFVNRNWGGHTSANTSNIL